MFPFDDLTNYELCIPGAVTGSTEVECPHCGEVLTVPVDDPTGQESYQCCECAGNFDVDWSERTVKPWVQLKLELTFDDEEQTG